jgi:signal peptidase I
MLPATTAYTHTPELDIAVEPGRERPCTAAEPGRRTGSRRRGWGSVISSILLAGVVLLILAATSGMILGVWRFTVIDTGSMRPTLDPGDVAILTSERTVDLRRGQIVAFHPPGQPLLTVMHRVVSLARGRDAVVIATKGDANDAEDPWRARLLGPTVWREDLKLPKVGYLAVWGGQRLVRLGVLGVIVILVVSMLMGWIWRPSSGE